MSQSVEASPAQSAPEMKGSHIILFVFLPTALVVGLGFILLAPILTAKKPGHLYVGLRFDDEASIEFIDKNVANPLTRLEIYPPFPGPDTQPVAEFPGLRRGKNILETRALEPGLYQLVFSSPGYQSVSLIAEVMDGEFVDSPKAIVPENCKLMHQFVGVVLEDAAGKP
jgi:hypothetical protein